jgi:hypothetical protein
MSIVFTSRLPPNNFGWPTRMVRPILRRAQQGGRGTAAAVLAQALADMVILGLQAGDAVAVEDVFSELGQVELLRLLPVNTLLVGQRLGFSLFPHGLLFHEISVSKKRNTDN